LHVAVSGHTPSWSDVKAYAAKRIEELHNRLECVPPESVSALQGQIKALREIIALPEMMAIEAANLIEAAVETAGY
jgi:hypothetical protein